MPSATSRACAPSCRSRSIRRSSAACASTVSARDSVSCCTRRASRLFSDSASSGVVEAGVRHREQRGRQPPEQQVEDRLDQRQRGQDEAERQVEEQPDHVTAHGRVGDEGAETGERRAGRRVEVRVVDRAAEQRSDPAAAVGGEAAGAAEGDDKNGDADPDRAQGSAEQDEDEHGGAGQAEAYPLQRPEQHPPPAAPFPSHALILAHRDGGGGGPNSPVRGGGYAVAARASRARCGDCR